jgi:iron complex transport system permease protein
MRSDSRFFVWALLLTVSVVLAAPWVGNPMLFSLTSSLPGSLSSQDQSLLWELRTQRLVAAFLGGASMSAIGGVVQKWLHNPLADAHILGVSSGGLFFGVLFLLFTQSATLSWVGAEGLGWHNLAVGAGVVVSLILILFLVFWFQRRSGSRVGMVQKNVLFAGLVLNSFFGAGLTLVVAMSSPNELFRVYQLLMGHVRLLPTLDLLVLFCFAAVSVFVLHFFRRALALISLHSESAKALGISPMFVTIVTLACAAILTTVSILCAGSVGFVGLLVPHFVSNLYARFGTLRSKELFVNFLVGGTLTVLADTGARSVFAYAELPLGVFLALLGSPALLFLIGKQNLNTPAQGNIK